MSASPPIAVLDMGASAIRLVIAEVPASAPIRVIEEASRGALLGRDTFSKGLIGTDTIDQAIAAIEGFKHLMDEYGVRDVTAVATSAVREARNRDTFLDRVQRRTGIAFDVINEAEESRLLFLALQDALGRFRPGRGSRNGV